jgi:hypothetical protein
VTDSLEEFQKIFGDIQIHSEEREFVSSFSISVGRAPERIETELFDVQCNIDLEMKINDVITDLSGKERIGTAYASCQEDCTRVW